MVSICFRSKACRALLLLVGTGCGRVNVELFPGDHGAAGSSTQGLPDAATDPDAGTNPDAATDPPDAATDPPDAATDPPDAATDPLDAAMVDGQPTAEQCAAKVPPDLLMPVPPMGWNGWNSFGCAKKLDAQKVQEIADVLVSSGMKAAGYQYVNLDDCWELPRSAAGDIVLDDSKLPNGMLELSSNLHARGFKFGVFRRADDCAGVPAGRFAADVATYSSWQIDLLKLVSCHEGAYEQSSLALMATTLRNGGRPVLLSIAGPPFAEWMPDVAQMVRNSDPIQPSWASVLAVLDTTAPLAAYARPGAFNDPDILEVGISPLTNNEARAHFSLWSILSAPLLAGNDLTVQSPAAREILTHREVIAFDQDPLGLQGALVRSEGDLQIYAKPLTGCGARAVVLFNRGSAAVSASLTWPEIWLAPGRASVRDLWAEAEIGPATDRVKVSVPAHDVVTLKLVGNEPPNLRGDVSLGDAPWTYATNGYGPVERNSSNGELLSGDGHPIRIQGRTFQGGLGVHAPSLVRFRLGGVCSRFTAQVGIDEEKNGGGTASFQVWADGKLLFDSGPMTALNLPLPVDVSVLNRNDLRLFVATTGDGNVGDHADWADAHLTCDD